MTATARMVRRNTEPLTQEELWRFKKDFPHFNCDGKKDPVYKILSREREIGVERSRIEIDWSECPLAAAFPKLDERVEQRRRLRASGAEVDPSTGGRTQFRKRGKPAQTTAKAGAASSEE
jgi:hypothetical protein